MGQTAWRTVIIGAGMSLGYSQGQLIIERRDGSKESVPLFDVQTIMMSSLQSHITAYLINELHRRGIRLVFCDEKTQPFGEVVGYYDHYAAPARLKDQIRWKTLHRKEVWKSVIFQKIKMQRSLLARLNLESDQEKWDHYLETLTVGDKSNREGQAARLYFNALFGSRFRRRRDTSINAALNYGYAILCSLITRHLTAHGYHPSLGIAHRGGTNPFNFSYDLIEPFRSFADRIVYHNRKREFDRAYKRELVDLHNAPALFRGKKMTLSLAVEGYILDVTQSLTNGPIEIGEVQFQ